MTMTNTIDYVTIATAGDATDFGDLLETNHGVAGCSNDTRGVFSGGHAGGDGGCDRIQYVTIDTTANAVDFGDLTRARRSVTAASDGTKGVTGGGSYDASSVMYRLDTMDYFTFSSLGNATDFGDLTRLVGFAQACSGD